MQVLNGTRPPVSSLQLRRSVPAPLQPLPRSANAELRRSTISRVASPSYELEDPSQSRNSIQCLFASDDEHAVEAIRNLSVTDLAGVDVNLLNIADCPHGNVIGIMRQNEQGVLTTTPEASLQDTIPLLNRVTGLSVIGSDGRVIGVISRKDIIRVRQAKGSMQDTVAQHMTSPAITIPSYASVKMAANLMLSKKIRRLPVVDQEGFPVGIVSRSDIFKPLFSAAYDLYLEKEKAALSDEGLEEPTVMSKTLKKPVTWKVKYLYDGDCPMCLSLMNVLKRQDNGRDLIKFVNIADPDYNPRSHMGISYDEAMETIHAIRPDGSVIMGTEALKELFDSVGLGWATRISEMPIVSKIVDIIYDFLSANRLSLGGTLDGIIAAKRMDMAKQGVETCGDVDEECAAAW